MIAQLITIDIDDIDKITKNNKKDVNDYFVKKYDVL